MNEQPQPNPEETSVDLLYETTTDKLDAQLATIDALDTKIAQVFTLASALAAALLGSAALLNKPVQWYVLLLAGLALLAFVVTLFFLRAGYTTKKWDSGPDLTALQKNCEDPKYYHHPTVMKEWIADECIRAYTHNKQPLNDKAYALDAALFFVSLQALLLGCAAIFWLVS